MDLETIMVISMAVILYIIVHIDQYRQRKINRKTTITQTQEIITDYVETKTREMPVYQENFYN